MIQANSIYKYEESLGNNNFILVTRDYTMGEPTVRKKVRRFYISFADTVNFNDLNDQTLNDFTFEYSIDHQAWEDQGKWEHISNNLWQFDLPRSKTAYFIKLKIQGELNVEILDISIIYRMKFPK